MKNRICDCNDWEENLPKMDAIFISAHIHQVKYDGKEFDYCPWCGEMLYPPELAKAKEL